MEGWVGEWIDEGMDRWLAGWLASSRADWLLNPLAAAFFRMVLAYKAKIGATYQLLIEPKPKEPRCVQTGVSFAVSVLRL